MLSETAMQLMAVAVRSLTALGLKARRYSKGASIPSHFAVPLQVHGSALEALRPGIALASTQTYTKVIALPHHRQMSASAPKRNRDSKRVGVSAASGP
eukprot:3063712-Pyramimonas_sp.AAC.1